MKLIICDFDGTLVKLNVDWDAVKKHLNKEFEVDAFSDLDRGLRRLRMVDEVGFNRACNEIAEREIEGFVGINKELLDKVREFERFAIFSSNTRRAVHEITRKRDFRGLSPFIVAKEDVKRGKPSHEGLNLILWWFDCPKEEAVFYGDSEDDRQAGASAGIQTVILT